MKLGKHLFWGRVFLWLSLVVAQPNQVFAQPYIAAEGFDRPILLRDVQTTPEPNVVVENSDTFVYWRDREGLYRQSLSQPGQGVETVLAEQGIRAFAVKSYAAEVAHLSIIQDRSTGRTQHTLQWQNEERVILETLAPVRMALSVGAQGPMVAYSQIIDAVDHLFIWSWSEGAREIYQSELSLEKIDIALDAQGLVYVSWLEGSNDRAAVGFSQANWTVYYLSFDGETVSPPVSLGAASNRGIQYRTKWMSTPAAMYLAWQTDTDQIALQSLAGETIRLEPGYPMGIAEGYFYWSSGASIKRLELATPEQAVNLIWAPSTIELADLAFAEGTTFFAWYGGAASDFQLYSANNLVPAGLTWQDRLARFLQLNPYGLWQGMGSRIFMSLLVSLLLSLGFTPIYWLLSLLGATLFKDKQAKFAGILLAWVSLGVLMVLAIFRSSTPLEGIHFISIVLSLILASAIVWLRLRSLDAEDQPSIFLASLLTTFISIALLSLFHFPTWIEPFITGF